MQQFSWRHHALAILRDCGLPDFHLHHMMLERQNIIPNTEMLYKQLLEEVTKRSRLTEGTYGNPLMWIQRPPRRHHERFRGFYNNPDDGNSHQSVPTNHIYVNMGAGRTGSNAWYSDTERGIGHGSFPTYASIPTDDRNQMHNDSEDDVQIFMVGELYEPDAESSSATSSDRGTDDDQDIPEDANDTEKIYFRYRRAKRMWRKHTGRPQRRFRRAFRIFNHDKFKQHHYRSHGTPYKPRFGKQYHVALSDATSGQTRDEFMTHLNAYFGKGKGKGKGKGGVNGFGRRKNPKDKQGNIMLCRLCKSDEHFAARCPMRSKGMSPPQLYNSGTGGGSHGWAQHGLGAASSGGYSLMFVNNPM